MKKYSVIALILFSMLFSITSNCQEKTTLPNDTRWVTKSLEYKSICEQNYSCAWASIGTKLKGAAHQVIVMDLDETVLDNSQYQVELFKKSEKYNPSSWNTWVKKEKATLVPGAKEFILNYKQKSKGFIVYISNRDAATLTATKNNLKSLGVFFDEDIFLLRKNKEDTKIIRRKEVLEGTGRMKNYGAKKVLAYFGDQMGDFPNDENYQFSRNKFIFPNPMYGKW